LARRDEAVALQPRQGFIGDITLVDQPDADHATFRVHSGKGVYMRSLARDISAALGTLGHVSKLRRLQAGPFAEEQALALEKAREMDAETILGQHLLPIGAALSGVPAVKVTEMEARRLQHGQAIASLPVASRSQADGLCRDAVVYATSAGRPVALAQIKGSEIRPLRVLNV
ncbi:MAG: tRNA pseudouridine(55) synthase TruB, partial [Rhodospirillales bacterium]